MNENFTIELFREERFSGALKTYFFCLFGKRITIKIYDAIKAEKSYLQSSICFNFKTFRNRAQKRFFQVLWRRNHSENIAIACELKMH